MHFIKSMKKNISVVVPFYNEEENIKLFLSELNEYLMLLQINNYEIICINDGSSDSTIKLLNDLKKIYPVLKIIDLKDNRGQSNAIFIGVKNSLYENILTLDGDCQNDPIDIKKLVFLYFDESKYSLIAGERFLRKDNHLKIISSKIANNIRDYIFKDGCKDTGCSLKIFKKDIFLSFPFFNGLHRFIPSLFVGFGYNVRYMDVKHRPRKRGKSKYGVSNRLFRGIRDMFIVYAIIKKYKN
jgi:dolichol-phosphate mannosyltransferase